MAWREKCLGQSDSGLRHIPCINLDYIRDPSITQGERVRALEMERPRQNRCCRGNHGSYFSHKARFLESYTTEASTPSACGRTPEPRPVARPCYDLHLRRRACFPTELYPTSKAYSLNHIRDPSLI